MQSFAWQKKSLKLGWRFRSDPDSRSIKWICEDLDQLATSIGKFGWLQTTRINSLTSAWISWTSPIDQNQKASTNLDQFTESNRPGSVGFYQFGAAGCFNLNKIAWLARLTHQLVLNSLDNLNDSNHSKSTNWLSSTHLVNSQLTMRCLSSRRAARTPRKRHSPPRCHSACRPGSHRPRSLAF